MDETELAVPIRPARVALGVMSCVVAGVLLAGCSGDTEPVVPPTSSSVASESPTAASTAPTTSASTSASASPTARVPSVAEVFRATRTAALAAQSGHAVGTMTREGERLRIDVEGVANGSNQTVFITTPDGGTAEVLTVGDGHWIGGDQAYWAEATGDPKAAPSLVGKYAPITGSDATELGSFALRTILTDIFSVPELTLLESNTGSAPETKVDGKAAYVLGQASGPRLWVAADGSAALLRAVGPESEPSDLTFSDWDRARTFTDPPPASRLEN